MPGKIPLPACVKSSLELELQRHLEDARLRYGAEALPKLLAVDVLIPHEKYRMVQNIESFCAERQFHSFSDSEVLPCREIPIKIRRTRKRIELQVTDLPGLWVAETTRDGGRAAQLRLAGN